MAGTSAPHHQPVKQSADFKREGSRKIGGHATNRKTAFPPTHLGGTMLTAQALSTASRVDPGAVRALGRWRRVPRSGND